MDEQQPVSPGTTQAESEPAPQPEPVVEPRTPLWRRRPVQLLAAAAAVAIGLGAYFAASSGPAQIHVRGTLQLGPLSAVDSTNFDHAANGDGCTAGQGYSDITAGATVVVGGSTGQSLGVGALNAGVERNVDSSLGLALGDCVFSFDVAVPGGQTAYTVTISHRGTQTFTPQQVAAGIQLTLGQ